MGNCLRTIYPGLTLQCAYDAANRLTNMVDAVGATGYTYDPEGVIRPKQTEVIIDARAEIR